MIRKDDRTKEQKTTHWRGVVARDKFMSGWGQARGHGGEALGERGDGISRCAWAVETDEQQAKILAWVQGREEMRNVGKVDFRTYQVPSNTTHWHIYVADPRYHPALAPEPPEEARPAREGLEAEQLTLANVISRRLCDRRKGWVDWDGVLSESERSALLGVFGTGCGSEKRERLRRCFADNCRKVRNAGIMGRVILENNGASYCAGQNYTTEVRTVRDILAASY